MRRSRRLAALALLALCAGGAAPSPERVESFDDLARWSATAAPGAEVELARDEGVQDGALRIDFDFHGGRGWVTARKAIVLTLPENYALRFWVRGETLPNDLEIKLVDPDGGVWRNDDPDFTFPAEWRQVTIRRSGFRFAWGPKGEQPLERVAFLEIAIATGEGGHGSVWLDELTIDERAPDTPEALRPAVTASTSADGHPPSAAADGDGTTVWRSGALAAEQWLLLDLGQSRDYGGLIVEWDRDDYATSYEVAICDDAEHWTSVFVSTDGNGGRDYLFLPEMESRYVRVTFHASSRGQGYGIREIVVKPIAFSASATRFFKEVAREAPPGTYPKYLLGEQTYWTVVGVPDDDREALLNEEGMLEVDERAFSIEPFLYRRGTLVSWHDVARTPALARGYLPMPSVTWRQDTLRLRIEALAAGAAGASTLYGTYTVSNDGAEAEDLSLFLAIRPFQVLPPWQSLNVRGGLASIHAIELESRTAWIDGERAVVALTPADHFGAAPFEQGLVTDQLTRGRLPLSTEAHDAFGYAEGAFEYRMTLAPGESRAVHVAVPFHDARGASDGLLAAGPEAVEPLRAATAARWERLLGRVAITLPPAAGPLIDTLKSTLAYILINRDGPAIQPGSRTYGRSWIRDGAFTSAALLQMGFTAEVRAFVEWFAGHQLPDGRIPCCVDGRGADLVPEHDSNGEFVYAVAEYYRYTRDIGFLYALWPAVTGALDSIRALRAERLTPAYEQPGSDQYYGLLPPSISHEGYSSHPVHAYWDDVLAQRGLRDGAALAAVVGDDVAAGEFARERDDLRRAVADSMTKVMERAGLAYLPASADLGDLDPNATAIAVVLDESAAFPADALRRTFDLYEEQVRLRASGQASGEAYTPYELRNVEAFVRLGERARANDLLQTLFADRRPAAWNAWQEIVWRAASAPRFIGDMPHTWVASAFVRALRTMLVYERESDAALVLAAGVPAAWLEEGAGVAVERLPTHYGVLAYSLHSPRPGQLRLLLRGDLDVPPGGIELRPPLAGPLRAVTVDGEPLTTFSAAAVTIRTIPAEVMLETGP
jgi:hypothetical protein